MIDCIRQASLSIRTWTHIRISPNFGYFKNLSAIPRQSGIDICLVLKCLINLWNGKSRCIDLIMWIQQSNPFSFFYVVLFSLWSVVSRQNILYFSWCNVYRFSSPCLPEWFLILQTKSAQMRWIVFVIRYSRGDKKRYNQNMFYNKVKQNLTCNSNISQ